MSRLKPEQVIKELAKKKSNRNCFDCGRSGPQQNVNTTLNTFVCTQCGGIHRKYNHKVKTINMSTFTPGEVEALEHGGNKRARRFWLASFEEGKSYPIEPEDPSNIDRFMQLAYVERRWVKPAEKKPSVSRAADSDEEEERKKKRKSRAKSGSVSVVSDRAFSEATIPPSVPVASALAAAAPAPAAAKTASATDLGIDFLSNLTISSAPASAAPPAASHSRGASGTFDTMPAKAAVFDSAPLSNGNTGGGLFDAPAPAAPAAAGAEGQAVAALVEQFKKLQAQHGVSAPTVSQWVQRALSQFSSASSRRPSLFAAAPSPASFPAAAPLATTPLASTPPRAEQADAFADIDLPQDEVDTGNPFDSSDDEEETSPSQASSLQPSPSPVVPHQQVPAGAMNPQLAFQYQQQQQQQQQQMLHYQQQQMMAQQQQHQQHAAHMAGGFGGQGAAFGQQGAGGMYGAQVGQQQQPSAAFGAQGFGSMQPAQAQFHVQQAQPQQPQQPQQQEPKKPDLFAGFGNVSGF